MKKLVYGVGINDANYKVQIKKTVGRDAYGRQIQKSVWICPFYYTWTNMLRRCYSRRQKLKQMSYSDCLTVPEWHSFTTFRAWMEKQDWEGKQLDKDLLVKGNKTYGPDACVFLDQRVNCFIVEATKSRGDWPIGVYFYKPSKKFKAQGNDLISGKRVALGYYDTPEEAHKAWLTFKLEQAKILASEQNDPRVAKALIERYENYV